MHRTRHLARHLPDYGWRPVVIRVDEAQYAEPPDLRLLDLLPPDLEQVRVGAFDRRIARLFGVGDLGLRAFPHLRGAVDQAVERYSPRVVFFTGFPFYQMLLAKRVKRRHRLPVVLDFQDPWVSAYGAGRPAVSKEGLAHRLAVTLEPAIVRQADFVTGVSEIQNRDMAARYPWLDTARMAAIPIGGDPDDFAQVSPAVAAAPDRTELRYIGAYWPRAEPVLTALFQGLALLRERDPALAARLTLSFVGTGQAGADRNGPRPVTNIAERHGVANLVREAPARVPFIEALQLMASAQGLLLTGSDEAHYTASKIYPALMSGRPYLSVFHRLSSANQILTAAGGGFALSFDNASELEALPAQIAERLADFAAGRARPPPADPRAYGAFTAHAVAGRFAAIFDRLTAGPGAG